MNYKKFNDEAAFIQSECIIMKILELINAYLFSDYVKLSETFKTIFDNTKTYYKENNQDENNNKIVRTSFSDFFIFFFIIILL